MLDSLLLVIPSYELRLRTSNQLSPYFSTVLTYDTYDTAGQHLSFIDPATVCIIEIPAQHSSSATALCQRIGVNLQDDDKLIMIAETPEPPDWVSGNSEIRIINRIFAQTCNLPAWLGLNHVDRVIQAGQLLLRPGRCELTHINGSDVEKWTTVKLSSMLRVRVMEYLMLHACGKENMKTAKQILEVVWSIESSTGEKGVQNIISEIRNQIEPDPKLPIFLVGQRGRGNGYYIETFETD